MSVYSYNGFGVVNDYCGLINAGGGQEGALVFVSSTNQYFQLINETVPPTIDYVTVFPVFDGPAVPGCARSSTGTNPGRWVLVNIAGSSSPAVDVPDWYIDPVGGSDLNDGTTAITPLQTFRALAARWKGITTAPTVPVEVHILDGVELVVDDQLVVDRPFTSTNNLTVMYDDMTATSPLVDESVALTGYTGPTAATNTSAQLVATPVADWATYVGKHIYLATNATGANIGAVATVLEKINATTVRVTPFIRADGTLVTPIAGNTIRIFTPFSLSNTANTQSSDPYVDAGPNGIVSTRYCSIGGDGLAAATPVGFVRAASIRPFGGAIGASVGMTLYVSNVPEFRATGCWLTTNTTLQGSASAFYFHSCAYGWSGVNTAGCNLSFEDHTTVVDGGSFSNLFVNGGTVSYENVCLENAGANAIVVEENGYARFNGPIYGTGLTSYVVAFHTNAKGTYATAAGADFYANGAVNDFDFQNGVVKDSPADLPFVSNATAAQSQASLVEQQ